MANAMALRQMELLVPGFLGYGDKKFRKDIDRLVRTKLVDELGELKEKIDSAYEEVIASKMKQDYEMMNRIAAIVEELMAKVDGASYEYAGFFSASQIGEDKLKEVYEYDASLFHDLGKLDEAANKLMGELTEEKGDVEKTIVELKSSILDWGKKFAERESTFIKFE